MAGHELNQDGVPEFVASIETYTSDGLRALSNLIAGDIDVDDRLIFDVERRADMLDLRSALPLVDQAIAEWLSAPAEDRGRFPVSESIAEVQRLVGVNDDGILGEDTLTAILADARSEITQWNQNPDDPFVVPINLRSMSNLNAQLEIQIAEAYADYNVEFDRYLSGNATNATSQALQEAHQESFGLCSELEILSLENIFENPEQFSALLGISDITEGAALNEAISSIIEENCGHFLDKFEGGERAVVIEGAAARAQNALYNALNLAERGALPDLPEPDAPLPNAVGPNGERDAVFVPPAGGAKL